MNELVKAPSAWVCDVLSVDDLADLERRGVEIFDRDYNPEFDTHKRAVDVLQQILYDEKKMNTNEIKDLAARIVAASKDYDGTPTKEIAVYIHKLAAELSTAAVKLALK